MAERFDYKKSKFDNILRFKKCTQNTVHPMICIHFLCRPFPFHIVLYYFCCCCCFCSYYLFVLDSNQVLPRQTKLNVYLLYSFITTSNTMRKLRYHYMPSIRSCTTEQMLEWLLIVCCVFYSCLILNTQTHTHTLDVGAATAAAVIFHSVNPDVGNEWKCWDKCMCSI